MSDGFLRVSTITPVYNNEAYLEACIQSLLSQTYDNMEIILVDDGSTDGSILILQKYEANPRVKVIYKDKNGGIASAYRAALEQATGDIISLLDADDIALPNRTAMIATCFESEQIGMAYSAIELINSVNVPFERILHLPAYLNNENLLPHLFRRGLFTGTALSFRNEPWIRFELDVICCDYDISLQFASRGYHYKYINAPLTQYRIHSNNTSGQTRRMQNDVVNVQNCISNGNVESFLLRNIKDKHTAYLTLGINQYYWHQNYTAAQRYLLKALEFEKSEIALFYLGNMAYSDNNVKEAYEYFKDAYDLQPNQYAIVHNYAVLTAILIHDYATALDLLNEVTLMQPYYLLIDKNIRALTRNEVSSLRLIHYLSDEDAVYNSYYRMVQ